MFHEIGDNLTKEQLIREKRFITLVNRLREENINLTINAAKQKAKQLIQQYHNTSK